MARLNTEPRGAGGASFGRGRAPSPDVPRDRCVRRFLWVWAPLALWLVLIAVTSSDLGARTRADLWIWRVAHEWLPRLLGLEPSTGAPGFLAGWVRKLAHVAEYGILGLLAARAWWLWRGGRAAAEGRGRRVPGGWAGPAAAVACCVGVAILDELHQTTLPSRTGSARDVLIDVVGVTAGVAAAALVWRRR